MLCTCCRTARRHESIQPLQFTHQILQCRNRLLQQKATLCQPAFEVAQALALES
jgi:hypothetical protein